MSLVSSYASLQRARSAPQNISSHLLGIVVTALAAMAVIAVGLVVGTLSSQRRFAELEMSTTARAISVALDQQLLITRAALESLAVAAGGTSDPEQLYRIALGVQAKHPSWSHVILRDGDGKLVFTTAVPYGTPMPAVANVAPQVDEVLTTGLPQITDLLYGPVSKGNVAAVLVPMRGKDGRRQVLIAVVAASKWGELLREQRIPPGWLAGIVDRQGVLLARTRASGDFVGKPVSGWLREAVRGAREGLAEGPSLEGEPLSLAFSRSAVSGWTVAFAAPTAFFEEPLHRSLWTTAAACLLVLGVASLLVLRYARRLSRSVTGLSRMAEAMRTPGAAMPPPPRAGVEELSALYDTMRKASAHLRKAEEQRTTAMRELQHRVKNDLQAILALIALEGGQAEGEETRRILRELEGRIDALRLVHSRLYEASQIGTVELGGYLRELCGNSVALYGAGHAGGIAFKASVEEVHVGHDTAVSLGLIANEFITNSAKHAFPGAAGTITLDVGASASDRIHLRLADDGVGLPPGRTRSSGMRLIGMLAKQVGAEPEWSGSHGTSLRLTLGARETEPAV